MLKKDNEALNCFTGAFNSKVSADDKCEAHFENGGASTGDGGKL